MDAAALVQLGILGGLLALDRTALLQSMASRPLVGATATGYVLGVPALGLLAGLLLELVWLMDLPVGSVVPPDETLSGILAAVFAAAATDAWSPEARAAAGVLLAVPAGILGRHVDVAVRRWNGGLLDRCTQALSEGRVPPLARCQWLGGTRFFAAGFLVTVVGAVAGGWVVGALSRSLPVSVSAALELVEAALPVLGAGAVLAGIGVRRHGLLFAAGVFAGIGWAGLSPEVSPRGLWPWRR
jgi:mannose/fructose/N-acetylgalactosamine-specific phosphotransferase system component IIC